MHVLALGLQATIAGENDVGPSKITDTMAFMFESTLIPQLSQWALESSFYQDYYQYSFFSWSLEGIISFYLNFRTKISMCLSYSVLVKLK